MTTEGSSRALGRPPGPSLAKEAVTILERNAFSALRGPNSRGAVPRGSFVGVDPTTVDRSVKRAFDNAKGRTPFDLASRRVCSFDADTLTTLQLVFEEVERSFRETDKMEETLRVFLRANFTQACSEEGVLAAMIVQAAACAQVEHQLHTPPGEFDAAREVIELRKQLYSEMTDGFVAGLAIALRRLRRRPKSIYQLRDIVVAVTATNDGFVLLHKLQPELFEVELVVDTQWSIIWNMTEAGLLDPPNQSNIAERTLVEAAIAVYEDGRIPSLQDLANATGISIDDAAALFTSDEALAQRCMDYAVGSSVETQAIAVNVKGAEFAAVRDLLIATTEQAETLPLLIAIIRRDQDNGFYAEARRHVAEALSQSELIDIDRGTADGIAVMLVDAALQGDAGRPIWEAGLNAFAVVG